VILVDTSTWLDHFRGKRTQLDGLLGLQPRKLMHPFVFGELLLNGLPKKGDQAKALRKLPSAPVGSVAEVAAYIEWAKLTGTGVGYVDTHLLVSAKMLPGVCILTEDQRLQAQAERLGLAYPG
jgi:hypothetical protein